MEEGRTALSQIWGPVVPVLSAFESWRRAAGVAQSDVARRAGVSRNSLNGWERRGFRHCSQARLEALLDALRAAAAAAGRDAIVPSWARWYELGEDAGEVARRHDPGLAAGPDQAA